MKRHSHHIYVKPEDDIITALELMVSSDLVDMPVVDRQGKILGDITISEILVSLF